MTVSVLDFYAIPDSAAVLEFPDENQYLGSVSMEQHRDLGLLFEAYGLAKLPPYDEDTRLNSSIVGLLLGSLRAKDWEELKDRQTLKDSLDAFVLILETADSQDKGIVAFCD